MLLTRLWNPLPGSRNHAYQGFLVPQYSRLIYNGFWYSPEMKLLQNTMDLAQENVWGTARLKLYKGNCGHRQKIRSLSINPVCHL